MSGTGICFRNQSSSVYFGVCMSQNEDELKFLADAVSAAKKARSTLVKEAQAGGRVVDFTELRQLDMDIKKCEDELRRSA